MASQASKTAVGDPAKEDILPHDTFSSTYLQSQSSKNRSGEVIGQLRIGSLKLTAPIMSGIADDDLARGVGHVPGTAQAGGLGNMVVAGHRDSFFRALRNVNPGMLVQIDGAGGTYQYQVDRTLIVTPDQLGVLSIGDRPQLTMITCFPFNYIGPAPKRFIVSAHLVSVAPHS